MSTRKRIGKIVVWGGVVSGLPTVGTAMCRGACPLDFPFCAWVHGTVGGACRCADNPCDLTSVGAACGENFCPAQNQTWAMATDGAAATSDEFADKDVAGLQRLLGPASLSVTRHYRDHLGLAEVPARLPELPGLLLT